MKENHAPILAVHPTVLLLRVALHLRDHLHQTVRVQIDLALAVHQVVPQHLHLRQGRLVQIVNVAVKIFRHAVVHLIAQGQLVRYRRGVKPAIHAGFVQSR
jgi:Tfp pilus assembly ATPase PilU